MGRREHRARDGIGQRLLGVDRQAWQHDPDCPGRMVADVASDADPYTGLAVYDSYDSYDGYGWTIVGGTSAGSPFLAGVIALAGNPGAFPNASYLYKHALRLYDITKGTSVTSPDGDRCGGDYLCNAKPGYDGPTGNGTPTAPAPSKTRRAGVSPSPHPETISLCLPLRPLNHRPVNSLLRPGC
jgi:hypothetical protein